LIESPESVANHITGVIVTAGLQMALQGFLLRAEFDADCLTGRHTTAPRQR
jgi:hypothetical protein